jgi:deoxyribonuclease V
VLIACVDVDYGRSDSAGGAQAAVVAFTPWDAPVAQETHVVPVAHVEPYEPGAFYKRELPCILLALAELASPPDVVIVDGHAWLGPTRPGLGARLLAAEPRIATVVGVAKTRFAGAPAIAVLRGRSATPLWVDEAGVKVEAAKRVVEMHGPYRVPTMLRLVDQLCRGRSPC